MAHCHNCGFPKEESDLVFSKAHGAKICKVCKGVGYSNKQFKNNMTFGDPDY